MSYKSFDLGEIVRFALDHAPDIAELIALAGDDPAIAIAKIKAINTADRAARDAALIAKYADTAK